MTLKCVVELRCQTVPLIALFSKFFTHRVTEPNTWTSLKLRFTTRLNKNARPVAPVNRVDISSARFVSGVSQLAHRKILDPPRWLKKIRPILSQSVYLSSPELQRWGYVMRNIHAHMHNSYKHWQIQTHFQMNSLHVWLSNHRISIQFHGKAINTLATKVPYYTAACGP